MDQNFRMVFLFGEDSDSGFIKKFSERGPGMLQFLDDLEGNAVQLDRMKTGAKISSVAGSSVGLVGGVLSIVGLALTPVTAGVSLGLTITGLSMGITSGVNSLVTAATEAGVNRSEKKKADETFKSFMADVQALQDHMEEVSNRETGWGDVALGVGKMLCRGGGVGKAIDGLIDAVSAVKILKGEEVIANAGRLAAQEVKSLRNVPRVASEIPDIGQAAVKGPLALSRSARAGLITVNALFIGIDAFFICKDSISLAKGTESEMSQFIRARAALWRSEMDSWQKIHDSLRQGRQTSDEHHAVLKTPFYPWMKTEGDEADESLREKQL